MSIGSTSSEEWFLASDFGTYVLFVNKDELDKLAQFKIIKKIEFHWLKVHWEISAIEN